MNTTYYKKSSNRPRPTFTKTKKYSKEYYDTTNHNDSKTTSSFFELFDEIKPKDTNDRQKHFLDYAANIAMKSSMNHKHGVVIVHKKKIISTGFNYILSQHCHDYSIHAEISAIASLKGKKLKTILPECELYVVRIGPNDYNNMLKYSKPCCNCQQAINKFGIKKAFYSTNYEYDKFICDS